ncbi:L7Ae/L30e/S12e/Gadd45 family ribosomal protein [Virgibacillus alimentarius]|uniref:Ribosomal protein L7Ae-like RNA K-turn-binding protein n=1 Tax=Virgibacillus alimentarius TaxID=698769 RepID=A0ABS4S5A0_9BACI|nr:MULTISPECIES: ribosomal L7Ae/L30e/S12e/Gadd45 family protein [Virgibacillus]MBP2256231.1 ribosomal protein L7Ae-like RNA K-turn-binding protein [Virgibacillus alimentarius]HLR66178.1 ribosomal L7Ae/L30e/S12e/Gadd45 family protein [Virgibacillus sp.]
MKNNYLNIVGLAYRARKCTLGEDAIVKDIQQKQAKLVLLANDIGPQTYKKITDKCHSYKVPFLIADDRETLSHAVGKSQRVAIAILDAGFAAKITTLLG